MTESDSAFQWETEALRDSPRRGTISDPPTAASTAAPGWATLREAHYQTGIPVKTLRKWARRGSVTSFLDDSELGIRRMVRMDAVRARAEELGRPISPVERPAGGRPAPSLRVDTEDVLPEVPKPDIPSRAYDEHAETSDGSRDAAEAEPAVDEDVSPSPGTPAGTMIVPIAAWDKMLMQLGNLHEAGQQLAESRERAAKAETEVKFLRERLGEMRENLNGLRGVGVAPNHDGVVATPETVPPAPKPVEPDTPRQPAEVRQPERLWRYMYRGWRDRRR